MKTLGAKTITHKASAAVSSPVSSTSPSPASGQTPGAASGTVKASQGSVSQPDVKFEPSAMNGISSKPLVLSTNYLTYSADRYSPYFTASSPDGYVICNASSAPGSLSVAWTQMCGATLTLQVASTAPPGTYIVHMSASTQDKVWNGKYIAYNADITVVITPSVSFSLSVGKPQYSTYQYGGTYAVAIPVSVVRGGAYIGSPTVTPLPPRSDICDTSSFTQTGSDTYMWNCGLSSFAVNNIRSWPADGALARRSAGAV